MQIVGLYTLSFIDKREDEKMSSALEGVKPMPGFKLELDFRNGSSTVVDMSQRIKTMGFSAFSPEQTFSTARALGDRIVWTERGRIFGIYCDELLYTKIV